jgi:hypothetical protein
MCQPPPVQTWKRQPLSLAVQRFHQSQAEEENRRGLTISLWLTSAILAIVIFWR